MRWSGSVTYPNIFLFFFRQTYILGNVRSVLVLVQSCLSGGLAYRVTLRGSHFVWDWIAPSSGRPSVSSVCGGIVDRITMPFFCQICLESGII